MTPIGLLGMLVFVAPGKTAADLHLELGLELHLLVERADVLVLVHHLALRGVLDIGGGDGAFLVHGDDQVADLVIVRFEFHLLQVEDDLGDVLDHVRERLKLVRGAVDLDGGDGRALERGVEHAPERIADGVAVTGLEGLRDELGVSVSAAVLVLGEGLGHFETA